jgi:predicted nucleic acid-binding protein
MRRYLLDSALLAAFLPNRPAVKRLVDPWLLRREAATSIVCYAEVVEYLKGLQSFVNRRRQLRVVLLREIHPYLLTYATLERYADIRRALRPPHGPGLIGDVDTLIAATAMERNLTIVTMDTDFQRVPGCQVMLVPRRL